MTTLPERRCGTCEQSLPDSADSWMFVIELEPPSQNRVASNKGSGRHVYRKYRDDFEKLLKQKKRAMRIPTARKRRRVFIHRLYCGRGKERDHGNIVGGCKPLLDAMTNVGLLVDDKRAWVEDHYSQERTDVSGVFIRIEEM